MWCKNSPCSPGKSFKSHHFQERFGIRNGPRPPLHPEIPAFQHMALRPCGQHTAHSSSSILPRCILRAWVKGGAGNYCGPRRFRALSMSLSVLDRPLSGFSMSRTFNPPGLWDPLGVEAGGGVIPPPGWGVLLCAMDPL